MAYFANYGCLFLFLSILISLVINLSMKKQFVAYTRKSKGSNREHSQDSPRNNSSQLNKADSSIYNAIMGQMECNHSEYINKLLVKQEKEEKGQKKIKAEENRSENKHERNKSYTNIIIENMDYNIQKKHPEKEEYLKLTKQKSVDKKYIKTNIFFSQKNSPLAKKFISSPKAKNQPEIAPSSFIGYLDSYIATLSHSQFEQKEEERISYERKTVLKTKQNKSYYQLLKKLESAQKKIKDLKLNNHILKIEETKQRKKNRDLKEKLHDMLEHMKKLTSDLEKEKHERKKMQSFFKQFQQRFTMMYPQRKTMQYRSEYRGFKTGKKENNFFVQENTTQQDESETQMILTRQIQLSEAKSGSSRKNSGSKTYKLNRMNEFNEDSTDSLYIPKHFVDSDESFSYLK